LLPGGKQPGCGASCRHDDTHTDRRGSFGGEAAPIVEFGSGTVEGGAGSLFFEAPLTLRIGFSRPERRGTVSLHRVNDVDGATPEQLPWHVAALTIAE
jgi:hypothetical protein